jgi:hypothetical protein
MTTKKSIFFVIYLLFASFCAGLFIKPATCQLIHMGRVDGKALPGRNQCPALVLAGDRLYEQARIVDMPIIKQRKHLPERYVSMMFDMKEHLIEKAVGNTSHRFSDGGTFEVHRKEKIRKGEE